MKLNDQTVLTILENQPATPLITDSRRKLIKHTCCHLAEVLNLGKPEYQRARAIVIRLLDQGQLTQRAGRLQRQTTERQHAAGVHLKGLRKQSRRWRNRANTVPVLDEQPMQASWYERVNERHERRLIDADPSWATA